MTTPRLQKEEKESDMEMTCAADWKPYQIDNVTLRRPK